MDYVGSVLPQSYQQLVSDVVTVRRDDVRHALSDRISNISHATLTDFDWTTKASIWYELILIRAARCDNAMHEPLCFAAVSFFLSFFFCTRSPRSLGWSPRNFATWSEMDAILKTRSKIWGSSPQKIGGWKTCFLARFHTISHFDREYLRNGTRYQQSENGVANYDLSRVCWLNLENFGPQTAKNVTIVLTHPPAIVQRTGINKSVAFNQGQHA